MTNEVEQIYFPDRNSWHEWLAKNHDQIKAVWLVHDKFKFGKLSYEDVVEEALCFGWIDGTVKRMDDETRSRIYLAVRKPKSDWASSNKERVERLTKQGLMQPAGLKSVQVAKENGSWSSLDDVENLVIPKELKYQFTKNKKAAENFENFSVSLRKQVLYFIYSAKQTETREERVAKLLPSIESGKNPFV